MHEVQVNRLGGLSLPRKSVVRLTDRPDMTLDVYRGRKTTTQQQQERFPVDIWCQNDVVSTSMRRHHVASTLIRRHFLVMCPLGLFLMTRLVYEEI